VLTSNLFAINYLKEHSPTISEFKKIWDKTPSETKKVCQQRIVRNFCADFFYQKYEALSKEKKVASHLAVTTTYSNVVD